MGTISYSSLYYLLRYCALAIINNATTRKARLQMALANATTEEEFQKIIAELQEFNSTSNTEKSDDSTASDSQDPFLQPDFYSQYQ